MVCCRLLDEKRNFNTRRGGEFCRNLVEHTVDTGVFYPSKCTFLGSQWKSGDNAGGFSRNRGNSWDAQMLVSCDFEVPGRLSTRREIDEIEN